MSDNDNPNTDEYLKNLTYDEFCKHAVYGIHIKRTNSALDDRYPHVCIGWSAIGDFNDYKTDAELNERLNVLYEGNTNKAAQAKSSVLYFRDKIKIGDYICYCDGKTLHFGEISSSYKFVPDPNTTYPNQDDDYKNNRDVVWYKDIKYADFDADIQNWIGATRSLFALSKNTESRRRELYEKVTGNKIGASRGYKFPLNTILYGPPGTGKTYFSAYYAMSIINDRDMEGEDRETLMAEYKKMANEGRIVFTTFHQSYGYEDFISGFRPVTQNNPSGNLSFKTADGVFKKIADKAKSNPSDRYVLIIDEINRGNISKIFGELITLLEPDKRLGEVNEIKVHLPVSENEDELFGVPSNLYVIGTMNTADKSISLIDVALRRRFEFIEVAPDENAIEDSRLKDVFKRLNDALKDSLKSSDLLIGHSYFIDKSVEDLPEILNRSVIPLLYEYCSDSENEVKKILKKAIEGCDVIFDEEKSFGRIKVAKFVKSESSDKQDFDYRQ